MGGMDLARAAEGKGSREEDRDKILKSRDKGKMRG